jgi:hypothetical protein
MGISGLWNEIIREMKKTKTVGQIITDLGYYNSFFDDNKLSYANPPWDELDKYIREL